MSMMDGGVGLFSANCDHFERSYVIVSLQLSVGIESQYVFVAILQVVAYVVTQPGRELLFNAVSQDEKYKVKVCIDVIVQRLGDATAAGMYKILFGTLHGNTMTVSLCVLPVCLSWKLTAFHLGRH